MNMFQQKAADMATAMQQDRVPQVVAFDPLTLAFLIQILKALADALGSCTDDNPQVAERIVRRPGIFQRARVRGIVTAEVAKQKKASPLRARRAFANECCSAAYKVGQQTTAEEIDQMFLEKSIFGGQDADEAEA